MALDFMAIVSSGTYPTPTPPTDAQRAAYAVSYGLVGTLAEAAAVEWIGRFIGNVYLNSKLFARKLVDYL